MEHTNLVRIMVWHMAERTKTAYHRHIWHACDALRSRVSGQRVQRGIASHSKVYDAVSAAHGRLSQQTI